MTSPTLLARAGAALLLVLVGCSSSSSGGSDVPTGGVIGQGPQEYVGIYGSDLNVADVNATEVARYVTPFSGSHTSIAVRVPDQATWAPVTPTSKAPKLCYYIGVEVDVDGDGRICAGDLRTDVGAEGVGSCTLQATETIPMVALTAADPCYAAGSQ